MPQPEGQGSERVGPRAPRGAPRDLQPSVADAPAVHAPGDGAAGRRHARALVRARRRLVAAERERGAGAAQHLPRRRRRELHGRAASTPF